MSESPIAVEGYDDVYGAARDLTSRDAELICELLDDDPDGILIWVADWVAEEKALEFVETSRRVAKGWVVRSSEDAWCISQIDDPDAREDAKGIWFPKSEGRLFQKGQVESLTRPQAGLDDYATDGGHVDDDEHTGHCVLCTVSPRAPYDEHTRVPMEVELEDDVLEGDVRVCEHHYDVIRRCLIVQNDGYEYPDDDPKTVLPDGGTPRTREGKDPRAPHWFDFNRVNDLPNGWSFEVLEWDDNPDADGVVDQGEAEVIRGEHRFVVTTWLVPRERTHDRYWSISYETVNQDGEAEPLSFHIGRDSSIARNNLGQARDVLDSGGTEPHVLIRDHNDGPRETFEYPTEHMAEKAADLQVRLKLEQDDRDYRVNVYGKGEWEDRLETERELQSNEDGDLVTDGGRDYVYAIDIPTLRRTTDEYRVAFGIATGRRLENVDVDTDEVDGEDRISIIHTGESQEATRTGSGSGDTKYGHLVTDGGRDYRIQISAPNNPEHFAKLIDSLEKGDEIVWNGRSEPFTITETAPHNGPGLDGVGRFEKTLRLENQNRENGAEFRLRFEEGQDHSLSPGSSGWDARCVVQRQIGDRAVNHGGWGRCTDVESLAHVNPVDSLEDDEERELRADGGAPSNGLGRNETVDRDELPDEVYAAHADYVRLGMKTRTARRMVGWLREYAEYSEVAGATKTAEHARHVANRLASEVEPESVEDCSVDAGADGDGGEVDG